MQNKKYILVAKQFPDGKVAVPRSGDESVCGVGHCPSVFSTQSGKAIVVGRLLSKAEHNEITGEGLISFHEGEFAVEVSPELLRKAATKL